MANVRLIKRRIKSAGNISQITKAMELVAASKMKKAQSQAMAGKAYAQKIYEMVMKLSTTVDTSYHPLLQKPKTPVGKRLVVVISTNKGLCGGLNTNLYRFISTVYKDIYDQCVWISLGNKGTGFITQIQGDLQADFSMEYPFSSVVPALTDLAIREFTESHYDGVDLVFSEFVSALVFNPTRKVLLPFSLEHAKTLEENEIKKKDLDFVIEPSPKVVFDDLLPHYVENQIRDAILQSEASEHSARMIAMRNATDNAMSLMDELTLVYNKARQEKITYEITDMVTARIASDE